MTVRTLDDSDMARIRSELHDTVVDIGAIAYIDVRSIYDVIKSNTLSSSTDPTTSATTVSAAGPTVLTLASVAGIAQGARIVVDVDGAREVCQVRAVTGSTVSVICRRPHSGTYPVEVESALTIVRGILADLETLPQKERDLYDAAGVKQVDEIQFFGTSEGGSPLEAIGAARERKRRELGQALGLDQIRRNALANACGSTFEAF